MGRLIDGNWFSDWYDTQSTGGKFVRPDSQFRNWITPDGGAGPTGNAGFAAQSGRYHLYVCYACPWAHRALIFRNLKELRNHISISVVHPDMLENGWTFDTDDHGATGDALFGLKYMHEIYQKADLNVTTRVTVPVLWDTKTNQIVSNESSEIIRMFNSAFNGLTGNTDDYWPLERRSEITAMNTPIYSAINNGVYKAGFATTQGAYDIAVHALFDKLDELETHLGQNRYLLGQQITEADWRLFTTLVRFDLVYHQHFKCNRKRITDYPNLWGYTRELFQWPGVAETVNFNHIIAHYHRSHETINRYQIVPINPVIDWAEPHRRDRVS